MTIESNFSYDPETGVLTRLEGVDAMGRHRPEYIVKGKHSEGYYVTTFEGKKVFAHRIAFYLMVGRWPKMIDHINQDKTDNRWANLREIDHSGNAFNTKVPSDNKTGRIGVRRHANKRGFVAFIAVDGKQRHLAYGDLLTCVAARIRAEKEQDR